jgi:hypothetical protein
MHRLRFAFSLVTLVLTGTISVFGHPAAVEMSSAGTAFLAALDAKQRETATYPLTDKERENWNFVPTKRNGLPLKEMSAAQRDLALALLRSGLSDAGFSRAQAITQLENVLRAIEQSPRRDSEMYFVTVFGVPGDARTWGWRFEGHHVSFNFTIVNGSHVFFTPSFLGTNPAEVREGPKKGTRVLAEEDDLGRAFVLSLDEKQRAVAVFDAKAPSEIITSNRKRVEPLSPVGISSAQLNPAQREALGKLTQLYLNRWRPDLADPTWAEITAAGPEKLTFAWAGGFQRGEANYYRIQSPACLIEFDNTQNQANHIHTAVRVFKGDFGHDLLAEHYANEHAK